MLTTIMNALGTTVGIAGISLYVIGYLAFAALATKDWWDGELDAKGEMMSFWSLVAIYVLLVFLMPLVVFWIFKGRLEKARLRHVEEMKRRNRPIEEVAKELNEFYEDQGMSERVAIPERHKQRECKNG